MDCRQRTYKRNIKVRWRNQCCSGILVSITYSESVFVALVIQHEMRKRRIISPSLACLPLPYFSTLFHKRHEFINNLFQY